MPEEKHERKDKKDVNDRTSNVIDDESADPCKEAKDREGKE
jgi:hypothetical protein